MKLRDESGQTLVLSALMMCILMGFMALAIDVGVLFRAQRKIQTQADAAATAAALCAAYGGTFCTQYGGTTWQTVASGAATANGMSSGATFTPHNGPSYGQHTGTGYYEIIITQPSPSVFMSTFFALAQPFIGGSGTAPNYVPATIGARAVAGTIPGQTCLYVLNPGDARALDVKGGGHGGDTIDASRCTIQVNSSDPNALCTTGGATIAAEQISVVGQQSGAGSCSGAQSNVQTGVAAVTDPFKNMTLPSSLCGTSGGPPFVGFGGIAGTTITAYNQATGAFTLTNGANAPKTVYETPVTVGGASTNIICFNDPNVTLASGLCMGKGTCSGQGTATSGASGSDETFVFTNGVQLSGNNVLTTIYGTLDISGGTFNQGNSNLWLNGPTGQTSDSTSGGPYTGFAFIDTSTANGCGGAVNSFPSIPSGDGCLQAQFGSSTSGMVGTLYAPNNVLFMQDSGGGAVVTNIISDMLWDNSVLDITNYNLAYTTSPLDVVRLVE
jgi:hypothetical protein